MDIKVYHNDKSRKSTYTKTTKQLDRYSTALKQYYKDIVNVYEAQRKEHYARYKKELPVSQSFHRLLLDAYAVTDTVRNVRYTHKNDLVDIYRVEFVIEHVATPSDTGFKFTTLHGFLYGSKL